MVNFWLATPWMHPAVTLTSWLIFTMDAVQIENLIGATGPILNLTNIEWPNFYTKLTKMLRREIRTLRPTQIYAKGLWSVIYPSARGGGPFASLRKSPIQCSVNFQDFQSMHQNREGMQMQLLLITQAGHLLVLQLLFFWVPLCFTFFSHLFC